MSTKKIQLPDFVIANLYTNQLVLGADVQAKQNDLVPNSEADFRTESIIAISTPEKINHTPKEIAKPKLTEPILSDIEKQWYLGNNRKHIIVVIKEKEVTYINDKHLQFLSNILNACKLNLGDIALVNHSNSPLS